MITFKIIINGKEYEWSTKNITGAEIRQLANIENDTTLFYKVQGKDEEIHDAEPVDLGRIGIEHFYSTLNHPKYTFSINGESFEWNNQFITGSELYELGKLSDDSTLFLQEEGPDMLIANDNKRIDLAPLGVEGFYSKVNDHLVIIIVKEGSREKRISISRGKHRVSEIKEKGEVPPEYELEQVINHKLHPLKDDAFLDIKGGEEFIGHVRDGASS